MASRPDPWERQPDETPKAFAAFVAYRDLGSGRSLTKVAEQLGKSRALVARWSSSYSWTTRVEAWDRDYDRAWRRTQRTAALEAQKANLERSGTFLTKVDKGLEAVEVRSVLDVTRMAAAGFALQEAALGTAGGSAVAPHAADPDEIDFDALTDEEIELRMFELWKEIGRDLAETAEHMRISMEQYLSRLTSGSCWTTGGDTDDEH